jgi:hypothetical protein
MKKNTCRRGHEYTEENLITRVRNLDGRIERICKACEALRGKKKHDIRLKKAGKKRGEWASQLMDSRREYLEWRQQNDMPLLCNNNHSLTVGTIQIHGSVIYCAICKNEAIVNKRARMP